MSAASAATRPPAVAGMFYPRDPPTLRATVDQLLAGARASLTKAPKALIAPHAGYVYSGAIAASAYVELRAHSASIRRVILMGPTHRVALRGVAIPEAARFQSPLGDVTVDAALRDRALGLPGVAVNDAAHASEHSLEVHLPFLQAVLDEFTLLPLVVGDIAPAAVAALLDVLWTEDDTLVVVSTDLSHYHEYRKAQAIDAATVAAIEAQQPTVEPQQACGCRPLNGLLTATRQRGMRILPLDVRNSGDTAGDRDRVVGYAAFAVTA